MFAPSRGRSGTEHHESDRCGMLAFVAPAMTGRLLNDNVAGNKMHRRAVVEFQPQLAVQQDRVVHSLCYVHLRPVVLERISESWQACQEFLSDLRRTRH